jgi:hypothetical protein
MVADFAAFDEFGHDGGDHPVAAMGAARRSCKGTHGGRACAVAKEMHVSGLL